MHRPLQRTRSSFPALLSLVVPLLLLSGCGAKDETGPREPENPYLPQTSAANVLNNLRAAYNLRNSEEYAKLFSADFRFFFDPADMGDPQTPDTLWWALSDELLSADAMLRSETVKRIALDFRLDPAVPADDVYPGAWKVVARSVDLRLDMALEDGDPLILLVTGDTVTFFLREYPEERTPDGGSLWRIVCWHDRALGEPITRTRESDAGLPSRKMSWGSIKSIFR